MISRMIAALAMVAISTGSSAAEPLRPTSKWNVDYDVAQCTASRNYGTEDKPLLLILKPSPFGGVIRVLVVRKGGFAGYARQIEASVQFDDQPKVRTNALKFSSQDKKLTVYSVNLPAEELKARELAKSISLTAEGVSRSFELDSIPALLKELEKCRVDLLNMYNADGTRIREEATPVKPITKLYSSEDYPSAALRGSDQGTVAMSLLIDETGKVMDCSVDGSAGAATLDTMSCYVIQERASFRPAIGTDGKPARSVWTQRITWRLRG